MKINQFKELKVNRNKNSITYKLFFSKNSLKFMSSFYLTPNYLKLSIISFIARKFIIP
jgi:hypothetical protein